MAMGLGGGQLRAGTQAAGALLQRSMPLSCWPLARVNGQQLPAASVGMHSAGQPLGTVSVRGTSESPLPGRWTSENTVPGFTFSDPRALVQPLSQSRGTKDKIKITSAGLERT